MICHEIRSWSDGFVSLVKTQIIVNARLKKSNGPVLQFYLLVCWTAKYPI